MMKFLFILLLSLNAFALTDTHLQMRPNKAYMNYFLKGYVDWHKNTFKSKFHDDNFFMKALMEIDHWKVPDHAQFDQILVGEKFDKDNNPYYTYRLYIHPSLRQDPFIKKASLPGDPSFIEWDDKGNLCYLIKTNAQDIEWDVVPKSQSETYFAHYCGKKLRFITMTSKTLSDWKNPFHGQAPDEIRTYSEQGLESIFYFAKFTHSAIVPAKYYNYINTHGENILLPFDKYSVDKNGNLVIYYP